MFDTTNQGQHGSGEAVSMELVSTGAQAGVMEQITRAEVDMQITTAKRYPRSLEEFYRRARAMATCDEQVAASCLYRLTRKEKKTGEIKIIEDNSIRMAEIVAACYGNMRTAAQIVSATPTLTVIRAVSHDLETNNLIAVEKVVKTSYADGTPYNEDLAVMNRNAGMSKAVRDAIFRVVPRALVKPIKEAAKAVAVGKKETFDKKRANAVAWCSSLKIDMRRIWSVLEIQGPADIGVDQLEILFGLKTAIDDGDQTVDQAFPLLEANEPPPQQERQQRAPRPTQQPPQPKPAPEPPKPQPEQNAQQETPPPTPVPKPPVDDGEGTDLGPVVTPQPPNQEQPQGTLFQPQVLPAPAAKQEVAPQPTPPPQPEQTPAEKVMADSHCTIEQLADGLISVGWLPEGTVLNSVTDVPPAVQKEIKKGIRGFTKIMIENAKSTKS